MTGAFLAGVIAGYGVAVPVGAIAVLIAGLTARTSLRVGAAAGLGAATADGVYALIAVLGGAALAAAITPIATPLRWVAAVTLILLAAHTARAALRPDGAPRSSVAEPPAAGMAGTTTPGRAYLGILGLTLLNPATIVYFAALVLGRGGTGGGVWFVVGAFLASASWQLLIAGGGALVGRLLTGARGRLITSLVSSAVIAVLAVALIA
ncbi:lysine transporter LysE [Actinoplanes sp. ATCC 53533]|uniref:LysE family transporter n=1 Tax=Actinoplanes sp. ATCC 53533 TaxID=1288362 RepID=UPI000F775AC1|nr:LysE family transporter [Actinoplanes sp. ATCC 53533]RSM72125.1 lysine transporter LysE [Actinoplanes sp. ATCC 53533]